MSSEHITTTNAIPIRQSSYQLVRLSLCTCLLLIIASDVTLADRHADIKELTSELREIRGEHHIAALYAVIARGNTYEHISLGVADHNSQQALKPEHYVRLGSVSKLFLGLTALKQQRSDHDFLATPIRHWVSPPATNPWQQTRPITMAQLLEHTAGFTDMTRVEWDSKTPKPLAQALALDPSSRELQWPPGMHSSYSNSGAGVAAYVLEHTSGMSYKTLVAESVFAPLGLSSATYDLTAEVKADLITGYDTDGVSPIAYWHTLYPAFGGINLRIKESQSLLAFFINHGHVDGQRIFSAEELERMHTPTTTLAAKTGLRHGYGLGLYNYQSRGFSFVGHGGDADGYLTHLAFSAGADAGYFVVINAFNNNAMRQIKTRIEKYLTTGRTAPTPPATPELGPTRINALTGTYQPATYRFRMGSPIEVISREGKLYTRSNEQIRPLIAVTAKHFRRPWETTPTIAFIRNGQKTYLQTPFGNYQLVEPSANKEPSAEKSLQRTKSLQR